MAAVSASSSSNGDDAAAQAGSARAGSPTDEAPMMETGASADPLAFDMGAFGGAAMQQPPGASAAAPGDQTAASRDAAAAGSGANGAASDPFAFNMGAFGGFGGGPQSPAEPPEQALGAPAAAAPSDPFASDMGAFGGPQLHAEPAPAAAGNDPFAADRSGGDEPAQLASEAAPQADLFAFDMSAFGGAAAPAEAALKRGSASSIAGADPFAFSMSSFGGMSQQPGGAEEDPDDDRGNDPFAADRPVVAEPHPPQADVMAGMLDMAAFGMGHMAGSSQEHAGELRDGQGPEGVAPTAGVVPRPQTPQPSERPRAGSQAAEQSWLSASSAGGRSDDARLGTQRNAHHPQQPAFDPPEAEPCEPLSAGELTDLERLLHAAAGLQEPPVAGTLLQLLCPYMTVKQCILHKRDLPPSCTMPRVLVASADGEEHGEPDAGTPEAGYICEADRWRSAQERIGLSWLDTATLGEILGLARVVSSTTPGQATAKGLDEPGRRLLTDLQVRHRRAGVGLFSCI